MVALGAQAIGDRVFGLDEPWRLLLGLPFVRAWIYVWLEYSDAR